MQGWLPGLVADGGPVFLVIIVLSIVTLTILLVKLWQLHIAGAGQWRAIRQAQDELSQGHRDQVLSRLGSVNGPIVAVLKLALGSVPDAGDRAALAARQEARRMRAGLRALETLAALGPLLGLLGTVFGMIQAFTELGGGRPDPAQLAGGIAKALVNTAGGLIIAILASAGLAWLEGVIERRNGELETALSGAVSGRSPVAGTS